MGPPALTETTIRYLYATTWLPSQHQGAHRRRSGRRDHCARHRREPAPHRDVEPAPAGTYGVRAAAAGRKRAGEGARRQAVLGLQAAHRARNAPGSRAPCWTLPGRRAGRRRPARPGAGARPRQPLAVGSVCNHCFGEAAAAGLVETKGRLFRKVVFTDQGTVESLRGRTRTACRPRRLPGRRARAHERGDGRLPADGRGRLPAEPRRLTSPADTPRRTR